MQKIEKTDTHLPRPKEILSSVFGYDAFRGEQEKIIDDVMDGKSCGVLCPLVAVNHYATKSHLSAARAQVSSFLPLSP